MVLLAAAFVGGCGGGGGDAAAEAALAAGRVHVYDSHRINMNTASRTGLMKLDGMSAALAERIIADRERRPLQAIGRPRAEG